MAKQVHTSYTRKWPRVFVANPAVAVTMARALVAVLPLRLQCLVILLAELLWRAGRKAGLRGRWSADGGGCRVALQLGPVVLELYKAAAVTLAGLCPRGQFLSTSSISTTALGNACNGPPYFVRLNSIITVRIYVTNHEMLLFGGLPMVGYKLNFRLIEKKKEKQSERKVEAEFIHISPR